MRARKDKITPIILQKIFNEHRRAYKDRLKKHLNLITQPRTKPKRFTPKNITNKTDNLQAAIVRYTDGC